MNWEAPGHCPPMPLADPQRARHHTISLGLGQPRGNHADPI